MNMKRFVAVLSLLLALTVLAACANVRPSDLWTPTLDAENECYQKSKELLPDGAIIHDFIVESQELSDAVDMDGYTVLQEGTPDLLVRCGTDDVSETLDGNNCYLDFLYNNKDGYIVAYQFHWKEGYGEDGASSDEPVTQVSTASREMLAYEQLSSFRWGGNMICVNGLTYTTHPGDGTIQVYNDEGTLVDTLIPELPESQDPQIGYLGFIGDWLYYFNYGDSTAYRFHTESGVTEVVQDANNIRWCFCWDGQFYRSGNTMETMDCLYDGDGNLLCDDIYGSLYLFPTAEGVYYKTAEGGYLGFCGYDGSKSTVHGETVDWVVFDENGNVYFSSGNGPDAPCYALSDWQDLEWATDENGMEYVERPAPLFQEVDALYTASDGMIYFYRNSDPGVLAYNVQTGETTKVVDHDAISYQRIHDWFRYYDVEVGETIIDQAADTDG